MDEGSFSASSVGARGLSESVDGRIGGSGRAESGVDEGFFSASSVVVFDLVSVGSAG